MITISKCCHIIGNIFATPSLLGLIQIVIDEVVAKSRLTMTKPNTSFICETHTDIEGTI